MPPIRLLWSFSAVDRHELDAMTGILGGRWLGCFIILMYADNSLGWQDPAILDCNIGETVVLRIIGDHRHYYLFNGAQVHLCYCDIVRFHL
jgi:hypothetical protein